MDSVECISFLVLFLFLYYDIWLFFLLDSGLLKLVSRNALRRGMPQPIFVFLLLYGFIYFPLVKYRRSIASNILLSYSQVQGIWAQYGWKQLHWSLCFEILAGTSIHVYWTFLVMKFVKVYQKYGNNRRSCYSLRLSESLPNT